MKAVIFLCLLFNVSLLAQTDRGALTGTVIDTTGARVSEAEIKVTSLATGEYRTSHSNKEGVFTISSLIPGNYKVSLTAAGFVSQQITDVSIEVGQTRTLSVEMNIASVATQVEVSAADSGLSKSSAEIGGVIQGSQAQEIPLNGRNYVGLVALVPGAIDSGTGTQDQVRFAGQSDEDNTWHLDGVDKFRNQPSVSESAD
jgi:hypothetical protein